MSVILAIDLGGTNCRVAVADDTGVLLAQAHAPVRAGSVEDLLEQIERLGGEARQRAGAETIAAAGLAVPGFVDAERGRVSVLPNLFHARDIPLRDLLAARWHVPVWMENDVKAAAMGELARGWGRELRCFLFVAIGTGTAAAVVSEGRLRRGAHGQAGEIAFTLTGREYLNGDFGEHGCLESFASGYGIARQYGAANAAAVFAAADRGDDRAAAVIAAALDHLAVGLSGAIASVDPEAVVLGGGIGQREDVRAGLERRLAAAMPLFAPRLLLSRLGADAQLLGTLAGAQSLLATATGL